MEPRTTRRNCHWGGAGGLVEASWDQGIHETPRVVSADPFAAKRGWQRSAAPHPAGDLDRLAAPSTRTCGPRRTELRVGREPGRGRSNFVVARRDRRTPGGANARFPGIEVPRGRKHIWALLLPVAPRSLATRNLPSMPAGAPLCPVVPMRSRRTSLGPPEPKGPDRSSPRPAACQPAHDPGLPVLAGLLLAPTVGQAREIVDMKGRHASVPDTIQRVAALSPPATYLVYAIDPGFLVGLNFPPSDGEARFTVERFRSLPVIGGMPLARRAQHGRRGGSHAGRKRQRGAFRRHRLGIVTALVGIPFFAVALRRTRQGWS